MPESRSAADDEHGITDADRDPTAVYLGKPAHARSVDDRRQTRDE